MHKHSTGPDTLCLVASQSVVLTVFIILDLPWKPTTKLGRSWHMLLLREVTCHHGTYWCYHAFRRSRSCWLLLRALGRFGLFLADALFPVLQFPASPSKAAFHSGSSCFAALGDCPEGSWPQSVVILKASAIRAPMASEDYYRAEPTGVYCQHFVLFPSFILPFSSLNKCSSFVLLL